MPVEPLGKVRPKKDIPYRNHGDRLLEANKEYEAARWKSISPNSPRTFIRVGGGDMFEAYLTDEQAEELLEFVEEG